MSFKKFRWSLVYESSEEELVDLLQDREAHAKRIHTETDGGQIEKHAEHDITIWCAEGSCTLKIDSTNISLQPGDAVRIDTGTTYALQPGIADCVYYITT